jgi:hypothetical protein
MTTDEARKRLIAESMADMSRMAARVISRILKFLRMT